MQRNTASAAQCLEEVDVTGEIHWQLVSVIVFESLVPVASIKLLGLCLNPVLTVVDLGNQEVASYDVDSGRRNLHCDLVGRCRSKAVVRNHLVGVRVIWNDSSK